MKDYSELKMLAEAVGYAGDHWGRRDYAVRQFKKSCLPASALEMISEVEALKDQLECADEQVVFLEKQVKHLIQESLSIKKDADRYRAIKKDALSDGSLIERLDCNVQPSQWDSYIDSVSVK